ncbi:MAG: histidine phosphotransferase family protein [Alphaproteobacteria bacterium]
MAATDTLRIAELMASRLCHDLVSPVGAVGSGLELFREFGEDPDGDALALVEQSARLATERLQFFRIAFGQAGAGRLDVSMNDLARFSAGAVASQRLRLVWPDGLPVPGAGGAKLLLNMVLLGADCLPRGGELRVALRPAEGRLAAEVAALALEARLPEELAVALAGSVPVADLTARTVQARWTSLVAERLGTAVAVDAVPGTGVRVAATLPAAD